jgi:5'-3' exonuclease
MKCDKFILLDGSYYVFFRFFATLRWWKLAKGEDSLGVPHENAEFVDKFKKMFVSKLEELPKKLKQRDAKIIAYKDCPRQYIWRYMNFLPYKANRCVEQSDEDIAVIDPGPFFKLVYREQLFNLAGVDLLSGENLEADDCIALTTKYLHILNPNTEICIVSSDHDFLQLLVPNVKLYNLNYKQIGNLVIDPKLELFVKCICGDKSDNIPQVFSRCGRKKATQMYYDKELFKKMCEKEIGAYDKYCFNKKLIDFNCIPKELITSFYYMTLSTYSFVN